VVNIVNVTSHLIVFTLLNKTSYYDPTKQIVEISIIGWWYSHPK